MNNMAEDLVIRTQGLTRYFGEKCAVDRLDLSVPRGCVFGFLGRNGSGKTTTIRMLLGLLDATRGAASVLGEDIRRLSPNARARIGYLSEGHPVYGWMRVDECERFQSRFYTHWNRDLFNGVIEYFRLSRSARARHLSRGERAGLCLALTLAPEPELLILDDPALGLDPIARRALVESMIYVTRQSDRTIFFSSHLLSDMERVADRIAVIDRARLRACCTIEEFRRRVRRMVLRFPGRPPELPDLPGLLDVLTTESELALTLVDPDMAVQEQFERLRPIHREEIPLDLEEAFISYVGERGRRTLFVQASGGHS
jgi:ABC-2 type transport system ATP-binding protein